MPEARQRLADQEARGRNWSTFPTPPPYSMLLVDQLREALAGAGSRADNATTRGSLAEQEGEDHAKRLTEAEVQTRQAEELIDRARTPEQRDRQMWLRDLARLRAREAAAIVAQCRAEKRLSTVEAAEQRSLMNLLSKQLEVVRKSAGFTQTELDGILAKLDVQRAALEKRLAQVKSAGLQSRQALTQMQQQLGAAKVEAPHDGESIADRTNRLGRLERRVALRQMQSDNDELAYEVVGRIVVVRNWERLAWQFRWLLVNSGDRQKVREALEKLDGLVARLNSWDRYIQAEILIDDREGGPFGSVPPDHPSPEDAALATDYRMALRERASILREGAQAIGDLSRTLGLWREDFLSQYGGQSARDIASDAWSALRHGVAALWSFELFAAEDTLQIDGQRVTAVHSVTVGKTLELILLVLLGSVLASQALKGFRHLSVKHLRLSHNRAKTISRWTHFVLVSMLVISALYLTNIPLTVFAFLGGALAIGIGFGTQVMLKNMISGVMLLVERPLRVGDVIEVGSVVGTVTNISVRSSTVRTSDGIEILVPNSTFIENNVTNWTYSNPLVRRSITLTTDNAASPNTVTTVLRQIAARHPAVLRDPAPQVLLSDIGGEAIHQYTLRYWIDYGTAVDSSQVASDLRIMMVEALAEAGIASPVPQRVIRLTAKESSPALTLAKEEVE